MAEVSDNDRRAVALLKSKAKSLQGTAEGIPSDTRAGLRAGDAFKEAAAILADAAENCHDLAMAGQEE